ncbi:MAG: ABC transporter permease [Bacteroidota bacterium]
MFKNFVKISLRNLRKFKIYSIINLLGLSIGLAVAMLIMLFVSDELSYDQFHRQSDRIYKISTYTSNGQYLETNAWPVAHKLQTEFPEVESVVYIRRTGPSMMVNHDGKRNKHDGYYAGETFFNIFSFDLIEGSPEKALTAPYSIVITEEMKASYFGDQTALGKTITLSDSLDFTVTGVVESLPQQSHIQFEYLASFSTYEALSQFSYTEGWGNFNVRNYILLKEGNSISTLSSKASSLYMDNRGEWFNEMGMDVRLDFIPIADVYLHADYGNGFGPKGSRTQVYLTAAIAVFIILLACINFINLSTARSMYRAKEVGLRKMAGSTRRAVILQFMTESLVLTLIAFVIGAVFVDLALPAFNVIMNKQYQFNSLLTHSMLFMASALVLLVSVLSGYYPALVLSRYQPLEVLKGKLQTGQKGVRLRRILVVFQFFISSTLVLSTLMVLDQLNFMRNQDLGFEKEQVLILNTTSVPRSASHDAFQNYLRSLGSVSDVSFNNALPGRPGWQGQWAFPEGMPEGQHVNTEYMSVDEHYLNTLGLELIAGENFDLKKPGPLDEGLIINETSVREMGWVTPENALGKKIESPSGTPEGIVIGVVKDYHGQGLQNEIWPKVMDYSSSNYGRYYAISFTTGNTSELLKQAEIGWKEYMGAYDFEYFFLNEDFDRQYRAEDRLMNILIIFTILASVIAGIGLLGLVSFMVLSRIKEIGVRKVLGASVANITKLLSKEFILLVLVANLLAIPLAWYFGNEWLDTFAYHGGLNPQLFVIAVGATIFLAIFTVSFQTVKAALTNPVDTLRDE